MTCGWGVSKNNQICVTSFFNVPYAVIEFEKGRFTKWLYVKKKKNRFKGQLGKAIDKNLIFQKFLNFFQPVQRYNKTEIKESTLSSCKHVLQ